MICIPVKKKDGIVAILNYLKRIQAQGHLLRLILAVVTGKLKSLVPATPGSIGNTFLRQLYVVQHTDDGPGLLPSSMQ